MAQIEETRIGTPDGLSTVVQAKGPKGAPGVILVHGILHCGLVWKYQFADPLLSGLRLVAHDLRGHGVADKPLDAAPYEPERFADEIDAVITASGIERPVLLGWSLGSRMIFNYFRKYGSDRISGFANVGARVKFDPLAQSASGHNALLLGCSDDLATRVAARREFVRGCHHTPPTADDMIELVACAMLTPPRALRHFIGRPLDEEAALAALTLPVKIVHGARDALCPLSAVLPMKEINPRAQMSVYESAGHSPFFEQPARFNAELLEFVRACTAR